MTDELKEMVQYQWLYTVAKIFHRDISLNNVMYRRKNGVLYGVLNDFDLSVILGENDKPSSNNRTGTKPFMAMDLLGTSGAQHRYRHDLESLFYVILYLISSYDSGKEVYDAPLQLWYDLSEEQLRATKALFLSQDLLTPTPAYKGFCSWTLRLRSALRAGINARGTYAEEVALAANDGLEAPAPFDEETLGGHFSFDTFQEILDKEVKGP